MAVVFPSSFSFRACAARALRVCVFLALAASHATVGRAQVTEPNGLQVPLAGPAHEPSLQSYFDGRMPPEQIDAVADASDEPSVFSPLCGFEAELVLSASSASAGLAWYNVPVDPNAQPSAIYPIIPETTQTGAVVSSAAIREDPSYAGGRIGFALTKFGGQAVYYSEASRNALCTACSMPGHWKMMLAYPSSEHTATYYLAWEDWEGANDNSWPNDGDFNDKLFRLSGVRCAGGGEPCDTGMLGACAAGLTECASRGPITCQPLEEASPELCDSTDNDCDGVVDDDARCEEGKLCVRGTCVGACGGEEFPCLDGLECDEGLCVEPECVGVRCDLGKACRAGACVAPCEGVRCPLGQECRGSLCVDPCAGVQCSDGGVCERGVCVSACSCAGCPTGKRCDASGRCVDPGCESRACAAGEVCRQGECVAACQDAACPDGAACVLGRCEGGAGPVISEQPPPTTAPPVLPIPPAAGSGAAGRDGGRETERRRLDESGCACRAGAAGTTGAAVQALWLAPALLWQRRRRRLLRRR